MTAAVGAALDSRLNRTASGSSSAHELTLDAARARGDFVRVSEPGDLEVRLFDDVFLGHAFCLGKAPNVTILAWPHGVIVDFPCGGALHGCRNGMERQFNWSTRGTPFLAHRVRKPEMVAYVLDKLQHSAQVNPVESQAASCAPFLQSKQLSALNVCGPGWRWCATPFAEQHLSLRPLTRRSERLRRPGSK